MHIPYSEGHFSYRMLQTLERIRPFPLQRASLFGLYHSLGETICIGFLAGKWLRKKSEDRRGICRTSCATSIPPRRRSPCKLFETHGVAVIPLSPGFRRAGGAPTSLPACGGALQSTKKQISARASSALICFRALRRGRDSNPRSLAAQQFSRLP